MADYYTKFSFILPLPPAAVRGALRLKHALHEACFGDLPEAVHKKIEALFGTDAIDSGANFEVDEDDSGLWFHSEDGGIDAVCTLVQHILRRWKIEGVVAFQWSHDCSKPRIDAYGGGAAIIHATEIQTFNLWDWIGEHLDEANRAGAQQINPVA